MKQTVSNVGGAMKKTVSDDLSKIKNAYQSHGGGIKGVVAGIWQGIKSYYSIGFNFINNLTGGKLNGIKDKFNSIFNKCKDIVRSAIDKIKSFFNFEWHLPHLKMPHFSMSGSFSDMLKGKGIPKISVDWYYKGAIFKQPLTKELDLV